LQSGFVLVADIDEWCTWRKCGPQNGSLDSAMRDSGITERKLNPKYSCRRVAFVLLIENVN
jgi:hypothetical protein